MNWLKILCLGSILTTIKEKKVISDFFENFTLLQLTKDSIVSIHITFKTGFLNRNN